MAATTFNGSVATIKIHGCIGNSSHHQDFGNSSLQLTTKGFKIDLGLSGKKHYWSRKRGSYAGTFEEKEEVERVRQNFQNSRRNGGFHACGDLLMRRQLIKENGIDLTSIPPMRLSESEQVDLEAVTNAVKKGVRLQRAIQAKDWHWPAENAGPMFFTPPLVTVAVAVAVAVEKCDTISQA
ncbi:hypothetical protein L1987_03467 [Smallanthus sonchifolius]|uniref:Uncharacterized protein n=1 Tax=Smallanthus sonchifolius TaxID=185202 RepID=A0ACB9KAR9_9ASTR|nr:hypothetical protein L1987_03467 [Smallanthus sonchifolius]